MNKTDERRRKSRCGGRRGELIRFTRGRTGQTEKGWTKNKRYLGLKAGLKTKDIWDWRLDLKQKISGLGGWTKTKDI